MSKDKTIAVVDGSGVLYDPQGLNRDELCRLARRRMPVKNFSRSFLGEQGFMVTVEEADVCLSDGSVWRTGAELRDKFHLTPYATADLFVPCGGRPNSVCSENVKQLFTSEGKPKFRMVVEGANLFFSDGARAALEDAGVHVFRDASTNKGGVTSSSLEVFSALALSIEEHTDLMTYDPSCGADPPDFYRQYVQQILQLSPTMPNRSSMPFGRATPNPAYQRWKPLKRSLCTSIRCKTTSSSISPGLAPLRERLL